MFGNKGKSESRVIFKKNNKHRNGYVTNDTNYAAVPEEDEDGYSDEDDVFVEDPMLENSSATKPLMHPRQRTRVKSKHPDCKLKLICKPVLYFVIFVSVLGGLMSLILYTVNKHKDKGSGNVKVSVNSGAEEVVGCDHIEVEDVWVTGLPKFITESSVRLVDVNQDGTLDIITGFATGADGYDIPEIVCDIYFQGTKPCYGGLIALEGKTGKELWRAYSYHEIFGVTCTTDFNGDGVLDCLGGGRAAAFDAYSGKDGAILWRFGTKDKDIMNFYSAQVISDLDHDKIPDILAVHGGDPLQDPGSPYRLSGKIMLISGKTGKTILELGVPDNKEAYYSPQIYLQKDGTEIVLFGTGGETHGGSLWRITLHHLIKGQIEKAQRIYTDNFKGVMTPPCLIDITKDGVEDIVVPMYNSSVLAINGQTFELIWNFTFASSETYSTPAAGYFNDDGVPDFLVKYATGPGFPIYYYSQTTIIDGKTGQAIIQPAIKDSVGAQASPLTISVEGRGNDIFLYWIADCAEHEGQGGKYDFVKGTNVHEQSRSDFCRLRFKTKGFTKMLAISQHTKTPGVPIYYSEERKKVEHSVWINTTLEAIEFVRKHPEHLKSYDYYANKDRQRAMEEVHNKKPMQHKDVPSSSDARYQPAQTSSSGKKGNYRTHRPHHQNGQNRPGGPRHHQQQERGRVPGYPYETPFSSYYSNGYRDPDYERNNREDDYNDPRYRNQKRSKTGPVDPLAMRKRTEKLKQNRIQFGRNSFNDNFQNDDEIRSILKRHVGPHDAEGLQRLVSTGAVAPTLLPVSHPDYNTTADVVFATYWFFPAKTQAILASDQNCIGNKLSKETERFKQSSKYYGMDHDAFEKAVVKECLQESGRDKLNDDGRTYESQTTYNPYNVHMGQMTVYRIRLKCTCTNQAALTASNKRCSRILPYSQQEWPAYMGEQGGSHWRSRYGL